MIILHFHQQPQFIYELFHINFTSFSTLAANSTHVNAATHIHPDMADWEELLFRFADANTIRVIYNRKAGAP